jgi:WhiB family transcriptional regulator, redox-sensing transcriptional regulator
MQREIRFDPSLCREDWAFTDGELAAARAGAGDPPEAAPYRALLAAIRPPHWTARAACKNMGWGPFFPTKDQRNEYAATRELCESCPARVECLADAMSDPLRDGMWAGTTPEDRRRMRRRRAA